MKRLGLMLLMLPLLSSAEVVVPIDSVENNVNIRMSPDSTSEIVGRLKQGDWMLLVESTPGWHEVEISGGATGFISADWSKVLDEAPEPDEVVAANEASEEVVEEVAQAEEVIEEASDTEMQIEEAVANVSEKAAAEDVEPATEVQAVAADNASDPIVNEALNSAEGTADEAVVEAMEEEPAEEILTVENQGPASSIEEAGTAALPVKVADESHAVPGDKPAVAGALPAPVVVTTVTAGPPGPQGPPGPPGAATVEGSPDFLMKFTAPTVGGNSQVYDDGNNIGIGTTDPKQRLEVNGNIQIHEQNSSVAGLMITQAGGETGYIMHNRASTLTIGAGSIDRITINRDGNVGFGVTRPSNPIELASGAHVTAGGVWTNSSSRERKENIADLSASDALETLTALEPVRFNYKNDQTESYVGFIAEDVPDLVATRDRDGLSAMDIVAVLTKVVQQQQEKIEELEARLDQR
jgi:hypothetical protein